MRILHYRSNRIQVSHQPFEMQNPWRYSLELLRGNLNWGTTKLVPLATSGSNWVYMTLYDPQKKNHNNELTSIEGLHRYFILMLLRFIADAGERKVDRGLIMLIKPGWYSLASTTKKLVTIQSWVSCWEWRAGPSRAMARPWNPAWPFSTDLRGSFSCQGSLRQRMSSWIRCWSKFQSLYPDEKVGNN